MKPTPTIIIDTREQRPFRFTLPTHLGGSHAACGRYVQRFLVQSARHIHEDFAAAGAFLASTAAAPGGVQDRALDSVSVV